VAARAAGWVTASTTPAVTAVMAASKITISRDGRKAGKYFMSYIL
jgi:hypothetical protein